MFKIIFCLLISLQSFSQDDPKDCGIQLLKVLIPRVHKKEIINLPASYQDEIAEKEFIKSDLTFNPYSFNQEWIDFTKENSILLYRKSISEEDSIMISSYPEFLNTLYPNIKRNLNDAIIKIEETHFLLQEMYRKPNLIIVPREYGMSVYNRHAVNHSYISLPMSKIYSNEFGEDFILPISVYQTARSFFQLNISTHLHQRNKNIVNTAFNKNIFSFDNSRLGKKNYQVALVAQAYEHFFAEMILFLQFQNELINYMMPLYKSGILTDELKMLVRNYKRLSSITLEETNGGLEPSLKKWLLDLDKFSSSPIVNNRFHPDLILAPSKAYLLIYLAQSMATNQELLPKMVLNIYQILLKEFSNSISVIKNEKFSKQEIFRINYNIINQIKKL